MIRVDHHKFKFYHIHINTKLKKEEEEGEEDDCQRNMRDERNKRMFPKKWLLLKFSEPYKNT